MQCSRAHTHTYICKHTGGNIYSYICTYMCLSGSQVIKAKGNSIFLRYTHTHTHKLTYIYSHIHIETYIILMHIYVYVYKSYKTLAHTHTHMRTHTIKVINIKSF